MKIKLFLAATLLLLVSNVTPASATATWVGNGAICVNGKRYYANETLGNCTGAFNGADLGYINSLTLAGQCQLKDKNDEGNSVDWGQGTAYMNYTIDEGTTQQIILTYYQFSNNNNYFQSGGNNFSPTDIDLSTLALGKHTLKINFVDYDGLKPTTEVTATFTLVPWEEEGTQTEPYKISTIDDLNALATTVNSGISYKDKYLKLTKPLDYSEVALFDSNDDKEADSNFIPIGWGDATEGAPFQGIFEGDNNTITGITVNTPENYGVGLFGHVRNASIKNLTLDNCSFTGNTSVGVLVGYCQNPANEDDYYPTIDNCHVIGTSSVSGKECTVEGETVPGEDLGGLVGYVDNRIIISNCTSNATVSTESTDVESVGGIIGEIGADKTASEEYFVTVTDCYYLGTNSKPIGLKTTRYTINISLLDNDNDSEETVKNATRLANYDGETCNVTLSDRTLYKDDKWNTLCLPFNLTTAQAGDPSGLMTLSTEGTEFADGTLTLKFESADAIVAGTPYIIKWASGDNISSPTFTGVTLSKTTTPVKTEAVNFVGSYDYQSFTADDKTKLFLGADSEGSKLYYPTSGASIGACRAYFQLADGITAGDPTASQIRAFVLNFDEDTNAISTINADVKTTGWYDLNGIKLNEAPATRGMYIHNGKKVMTK